jgi:predicted metal-dependent peptidase
MDIDPRMTRLRSQLIVHHPFFGFLASRLQLMSAPGIGTMATDGKRWLYDPAFLDRCNDPKLLFVGAHEVLHCALNHTTRRGNRDPELWNVACDHVVNLSLREAGFVVPQEAYCDVQFKGMHADDVYRILKTQQQEQPEESDDQEGDGEDDGQNQSGDKDGNDDDVDAETGSTGQGTDDADSPANGSNSGNAGDDSANGTNAPISDPGDCGAVIDAAPQNDQSTLDDVAEEWNVAVRQATNFARRQGEGRLPGFIEEIITNLNRPKVDWRDVLRSWIEPSSTKDYTWARPNRRMLPFGIIAPGTTTDGIHHVGIAVDDSASVSSEMLQQFASEAQAALDDGKIDKLTVVFCDDRVQSVTEYVMGEIIDLKAKGRGGTRFDPAFAWFTENAPDVAGVVYLTDLDSSSFGSEPPYRVLWAGYEQPMFIKQLCHRMDSVPFGECIELN